MNKKAIFIFIILIIIIGIGVVYLITTEKHKQRHIVPHAVTAPTKAPPVSNDQKIITDKDIDSDGYDDQTNY